LAYVVFDILSFSTFPFVFHTLHLFSVALLSKLLQSASVSFYGCFMAQKKKDTVRATIRLLPEHKEVLDIMAHWSGVPFSELLRGMIEPAMPALTSLVRTLSNVDGDPPPRTFAALADVMYWEEDAKKLLADLSVRVSGAEETSRDDYMDMSVFEPRKSSVSVRAAPGACEDRSAAPRRRGRPKKSSQPPYSNTGVIRG